MNPERKHRQFWAITENHTVELVTGYECPNTPGMWWVPKLGWSMSVTHHLFDCEQDAVNKLKSDLTEQIARLTDALARLEAK